MLYHKYLPLGVTEANEEKLPFSDGLTSATTVLIRFPIGFPLSKVQRYMTASFTDTPAQTPATDADVRGNKLSHWWTKRLRPRPAASGSGSIEKEKSVCSFLIFHQQVLKRKSSFSHRICETKGVAHQHLVPRNPGTNKQQRSVMTKQELVDGVVERVAGLIAIHKETGVCTDRTLHTFLRSVPDAILLESAPRLKELFDAEKAAVSK
jgi:hypothetical protein